MKSKTSGLRIAGYIITGLMIISCQQKSKPKPPKGFEKVEAPKEAYSQLKNPEPVLASENISISNIQMGAHSFIFLVDGKPFSGDIIQSGEVSTVSEKELVIKSTEKGQVSMRYVLPGNLRIPVKPGEKFSIDFRRRFYLNSIGYSLSNYTGDEFVHASGNVSDSDTISVGLSKGIYIYQVLDKKSEERKSNFGTIRDIPVYLNVDGRRIPLIAGKPQEVDIKGSKFVVVILISTEMHPTPEKRSSSEGDGFSLEYAIVKK